MSSRPPARPVGLSRLLHTGFGATTRIVRDTHQAIAGRTFATLVGVPVIGAPARLVEHAHNAIAESVYAAIGAIGSGVLGLADEVEAVLLADAATRLPMALRSPLNAAVGDHLDASGNALAIPMSLRTRDTELVLQRAALKAALPDAGPRICVLIHGLGCSEATFFAAAPQCELGEELAREFGYTPLFLRYNTGLAIERNGELLAAKLDQLLRAWPHPNPELLLIAHSMGGLVARSACAQAVVDARWPLAVRMLISLGSPNTGAPLARHGQQLQRALDNFDVSAPIGRLGNARSRGVKDLHDGHPADTSQRWPHIALRFVGGHLGDHPGSTAATWFGDGLVPIHSATTLDGLTPTQSAVLSSVGHLQLPVDPRCWEQVREWVQADLK